MSENAELARYVMEHFDYGAERASLFIAGESRSSARDAPLLPASVTLPSADTLSADWEGRQFQGYLFDVVAARVGVRQGTSIPTDPILDRLARRVGVNDYFDAYCVTRGLDPTAIIGLAEQFLDETKGAYFGALADQIPAVRRSVLTMDSIQAALSDAVRGDPERYPYKRTITEIRTSLTNLALSSQIDMTKESAIGLTANVADVNSRTARLFLEPAAGLESYRGALHGLGHSVFTVVKRDIVDDLGVDIAATEAVAFQAQHLALGDAHPGRGAFLRFLHLYQARLYALRVIHEKIRNSGRAVAADDIADLGKEHLGIRDLAPLRFRPKLVAVDFLLAFADFFDRGEIAHDWFEVFDLASVMTNQDLAWRLRVADPSVLGVSAGPR